MDATTIAEKITTQQPEFGGTVWTTRDKAKIDVADMTPSHAANAAAMLVRSTARMLSTMRLREFYTMPPSDREDVQAEHERQFEELFAVKAEDVMRATTLGAALYARAEDDAKRRTERARTLFPEQRRSLALVRVPVRLTSDQQRGPTPHRTQRPSPDGHRTRGEPDADPAERAAQPRPHLPCVVARGRCRRR